MNKVLAATAAVALMASVGPVLADGEATYKSICFACHGTGAAGAPKLGDKAMWAPRIATGNDALYAAAINGKGAMPAKGGNPALSDGDIKGAVDYMVGQSK